MTRDAPFFEFLGFRRLKICSNSTGKGRRGAKETLWLSLTLGRRKEQLEEWRGAQQSRPLYPRTVDTWVERCLSLDYKAIALISGDNGSRTGDNAREKLCTMNEPLFDRTMSYQLRRISSSRIDIRLNSYHLVCRSFYSSCNEILRIIFLKKCCM